MVSDVWMWNLEKEFVAKARTVINATGPFSDGIRQMDNPDVTPVIQPSQGVHITLDRSIFAR